MFTGRFPPRLALAIVRGASLFGCGEPSFAVGDCVHIERRVLGHELTAADCSSARGTFDASERIYKIDEVLEGANAPCGPPQGFFSVTFSHEPDDVTYCMSQAE